MNDQQLTRKCLLVLDCQNDFLEGKYAVPGFKETIEKIVKVLDKWQGLVVFSRYVLTNERGRFKDDLGVPGSKGVELVDALQDYSHKPQTLLIDKHSYSAFAGTTLQNFLGENGVHKVYIVGAKTEWCVLATAFNAFDLGYQVYLVEDCLVSRDLDFHRRVLKKHYFGIDSIVTSDEMI